MRVSSIPRQPAALFDPLLIIIVSIGLIATLARCLGILRSVPLLYPLGLPLQHHREKNCESITWDFVAPTID